MKRRSAVLWLLALIITLTSAYYQRTTGPTWPVRGQVAVDGQEVRFRLPRSHEGEAKPRVAVIVPDSTIFGYVRFQHPDAPDVWRQTAMFRHGDTLVAELPSQRPMRKIPYQSYLVKKGSPAIPLTPAPLQIRIKGRTPLAALLPHVILMFAAMLFSTRAGLEAAVAKRGSPRLAFWTVAMLFVGGLALGALVTKYAFGVWWTGWPVGNDLTDNKTAISFLVWVVAWLRVRRHPRRRLAVLVAAVVLLAIFLIPHSA